MGIDSNLEVIKSALIYGDVDDAMRLITRRKANLQRSVKKGNVLAQKYLDLFDSLEKLLKGQMSLEQFKDAVGKIEGLENLLEDSTGEEGYLSSLFYLLQLSIDRYNIVYPSYDMKRCDDA